MIRAVIVFCLNDKKFTGIQVLKPCKYSIAFIEAGIPAAVYAKRKKTAFFQKRKRFCERRDTCLFSGSEAVVASRQVSEIKGNAAYRSVVCILVQMFVGIQDQSIVLGRQFFFQKRFCICKSLFLNIIAK